MDNELLSKVGVYANSKCNESDKYNEEFRHGYFMGVRDALFLAMHLEKGEDAEGNTDENDMIDRILKGWSAKQLGE